MHEEELRAVVTLVDEYTQRARQIMELNRAMQQSMNNVTPRINAPRDRATGKLQKLKSLLLRIKNTVVRPRVTLRNISRSISSLRRLNRQMISTGARRVAVRVRDGATRTVRGIGGKLRALIKKKWQARVSLKDNASKGIGAIKGALLGLAGGALIGGTLKKGAELEQQKVSMRHFMGVGNSKKSSKELDNMTGDYVKQLRRNANATPFETAEVMRAGTRALTISGGNTKESMRLVKLAEDMAASDPNKTIGDAIEALADAKMGEFERLKEFGFKGSKEDFDKAGGDFFKMKGTDGKSLTDTFGGLSAKQANTGLGLFSTIKGNLGSLQQNIGGGILDGLKPTMKKIVDLFGGMGDNAGASFGRGIGEAFNYILDNALKAKGAIQGFFNDIGNMMPQGASLSQIFGKAVSGAFEMMKPAVEVAGTVIKGVLKFIIDHASQISNIIGALKSIWIGVWNAIKILMITAGPIIKKILSAILWGIDKIADAVKTVGDAWNSFVNNLKKPATVNVNTSKVDNMLGVSKPSTGGGKGKKKAYGMSRVPYDNYPALLHEGERVLTKQESNQMDKGVSNGFIININGLTVREEADIDKIVMRLTNKIKLAKAGGI